MYTLAAGERDTISEEPSKAPLYGMNCDYMKTFNSLPHLNSHSHGDLPSMASCENIGGGIERMED